MNGLTERITWVLDLHSRIGFSMRLVDDLCANLLCQNLDRK